MKQTEKEFQASLAARLGNAAPTGAPAPVGMHMNVVPSGPTRSLEELVSADKQEGLPAAPASSGVTAADVIHHVPIHLVVDSPYQPRTKYDETQLQALAIAMLERGQDDPITVRKIQDDKFELISGHRRTRAARLNGWPTIQAKIVELDDEKAEIAALVSNESSVGLSEYEKAKSYQRAFERGFVRTQEQCARLFVCSQARVSQLLSMLKLPERVVDLLEKYPGLFGYRYTKTIQELASEYPSNIETIVEGLETLIDNPDQEPEAVVDYVRKALRTKVKRGSPTRPVIIPTKAGSEMFSVKVTDSQIVVNVMGGHDTGLTSKRLMAALRDLANSVEE